MKIKGNVLIARRVFVEKHFGADSWGRVVRGLPEDVRVLVQHDSIRKDDWYPFQFGEKLDRAIVQELGMGDTRIFEGIGAASAKENLNGAHQVLLRQGDPDAFLTQTPVIYKLYYDTGHRTFERTGPQSARLITRDADTFSAIDCLTVIGWHKEALRMCGAKEVRMTETECRALAGRWCQYEISWST
jgi:hypothetical protein